MIIIVLYTLQESSSNYGGDYDLLLFWLGFLKKLDNDLIATMIMDMIQ